MAHSTYNRSPAYWEQQRHHERPVDADSGYSRYDVPQPATLHRFGSSRGYPSNDVHRSAQGSALPSELDRSLVPSRQPAVAPSSQRRSYSSAPAIRRPPSSTASYDDVHSMDGYDRRSLPSSDGHQQSSASRHAPSTGALVPYQPAPQEPARQPQTSSRTLAAALSSQRRSLSSSPAIRRPAPTSTSSYNDFPRQHPHGDGHQYRSPFSMFDDFFASMHRDVPSGNVVYHKKTSRTYNIYEQCGEENSTEKDSIAGRETLSVNRVLGDRGCEMVRTRNLHTGQEDGAPVLKHRGYAEADLDIFERDWHNSASRVLPRYMPSIESSHPHPLRHNY